MRIFLLGSGFSASSGYLPTAAKLFSMVMNHPITNSSAADHKYDLGQIIFGLTRLYPNLDDQDPQYI